MMQPLTLVGILGALLGLTGLVLYSLAPEQLCLVTLCEGLALIGLVIFFVGHFETLKAVSARRSTRLGANTVLMVVLFVGIVIIANVLAARHAKRWDLSETLRFTLAPQTHDVLRGLTHEVTITVFTQSNAYKDLLDAYRHATDQLRVEYLDPETQPAIARQYGITRRDTAVFESGGRSTRVTTPSEVELTAALIRVSKDTKKQIVFLEGHGERDIFNEEPDGYSLATEAMKKQGYAVSTLLLLQEPRVPEETTVLVIAGPVRRVTGPEQDRIARYVAEGGRLLVFTDPQSDDEREQIRQAHVS